MSLSDIEDSVDMGDNHATATTHQGVNSSSWVDRMLQSMESKNVDKDFQYSATVHPCIIDGKRVLVYTKGLHISEPIAYTNLKQFAEDNNFELKEDKRSVKKTVQFERRTAKIMPLLFLSSGQFVQAAETDTL